MSADEARRFADVPPERFGALYERHDGTVARRLTGGVLEDRHHFESRRLAVGPGFKSIGRQSRNMSKTAYRIVSGEESEIHDEPHIEASRVTVRFVHERVEGLGKDPKEVAAQHDLDLADVYQALAYYHDHAEEMGAVERRREATIEQHEDELVGPEDVQE